MKPRLFLHGRPYARVGVSAGRRTTLGVLGAWLCEAASFPSQDVPMLMSINADREKAQEELAVLRVTPGEMYLARERARF